MRGAGNFKGGLSRVAACASALVLALAAWVAPVAAQSRGDGEAAAARMGATATAKAPLPEAIARAQRVIPLKAVPARNAMRGSRRECDVLQGIGDPPIFEGPQIQSYVPESGPIFAYDNVFYASIYACDSSGHKTEVSIGMVCDAEPGVAWHTSGPGPALDAELPAIPGRCEVYFGAFTPRTGLSDSRTSIITYSTGKPPVATLTSPTGPIRIVRGTPFTATATASDPEGELEEVQFVRSAPFGEHVLATDKVAPFSVLIDTSALNHGTFQFFARAVDAAGNRGDSAPIQLTVHRAPTVALSFDPEPTPPVAAPASVTLAATASDPDGGAVTVEFLRNGQLLATDTTAPFRHDVTGLSPGTYTFTARAIDNYGASATAERTLTVAGPSGPSVSLLIDPPAGTPLHSPATLSLTVQETNGRPLSRVEFRRGGALVATVTSEPYRYTASHLREGSHTFEARAFDAQGASATVSHTATVANGSSNVSLFFDPPPVNLTAPATVHARSEASDPEGLDRVEYWLNGALLGSDHLAPYTWTMQNLPAGTHRVIARAVDTLGKVTSTPESSFTVSTASNQPPTVSITSPTGSVTAPAGAPVTFTVTASDPEGALARVEYLSATNALLATVSQPPYSTTFTGLPVGTHVIRARAVDSSGLSGESATRTVQITANQAPTVSLSAPANGSVLTPGSTVTLSANANDADGRVIRVEYYYLGQKIAESSTPPFTATWVAAGNGHASPMTVRAIDDSGASTNASQGFWITVGSNRAPTLTLGSPSWPPSFSQPRDPAFNVYQPNQRLVVTGTMSDPDRNVARIDLYRDHYFPSDPTRNRFASHTVANGYDINYSIETIIPASWAVNAPIRIFAVAFDRMGASSVPADSDPPSVPIAVIDPATVQSPCGPAVGDDYSCTEQRHLFPSGSTPAIIEAERFDQGGHGVAYFDTTLDLLNPFFSPRFDHVDLDTCNWHTGSCMVRMEPGEWMEYSVTVPTSGRFTLHMQTQVASAPAQGTTGGTLAPGPRPDDQRVFVEAMFHDAEGALVATHTAALEPESGSTTSTTGPLVPVGTFDLPANDYVMGFRFYTQGGFDASHLMDYFRITRGNGSGSAGVAIVAPANGSSFAPNAPVNVVADVTGAVEDATSVEFFSNGAFLGSDSSPPWNFVWMTPGQAPASYTLTARAVISGVATPHSPGIIVNVAHGAARPPTVTLTSPAAGSSFANGAQVTLAANATDDDGSIQRVEFLLNGAPFTPALIDTAAPYTLNWTPPAAGTYRLSARAVDNQNNVGQSGEVTIQVGGASGLAIPPAAAIAPIPGAEIASDVVGATPGQFRVDESGNATYQIPLYMAPGVNGLVPQLSLSYSSGGVDGYLGPGWSLDGMQAITRCRRSFEAGDPLPRVEDWFRVAHDPLRFVEPLNNVATERDEYCLNGQRLIPVAGTHGSAGAEYRTELDGFAVIRAVDDAGVSDIAGAEEFTVEGKDGAVLSFGGATGIKYPSSTASTLSRLMVNAAGNAYVAAGKRAVMTWALSRVQDRSGNRIEYFYEQPAGEPGGEQYLKEIHYGGHSSGLSPLARAVLFYGNAPITEVSYAGGMKLQRSRRLERIEVYNGAQLVRSYWLSYGSASPTTGRARLDSVRECADATGTVCYPATRFDWTSVALGVDTGASVNLTQAGEVATGVKFGDINGDGRTDLVWARDQSGNAQDVCWSIAAPTGFAYTTTCNPAWSLYESSQTGGAAASLAMHLLDLSGDGRDDLLIARKDRPTWEVFRGTATGFESTGLDAGIPMSHGGEAVLADFNGDGRLDALWGAGPGSGGPGGGGITDPPCPRPCHPNGVEFDIQGTPPRLDSRTGLPDPASVSNPGIGVTPVVSLLGSAGCAQGLSLCFGVGSRGMPGASAVRFSGHVASCGTSNPNPTGQTSLRYEGGIEVMDFDGDGANDLRVKVVPSPACSASPYNLKPHWVIYRNAGWKSDGSNPQAPTPRFLSFERIASFEIGEGPGLIHTPPFDRSNPRESRDYRFHAADLNGDGATDLLYARQTGSGRREWVYQLSTGRVGLAPGNGLQLELTGPHVAGLSTNEEEEKTLQVLDYDGDGRVDALHGVDSGSTRQFVLRRFVAAGQAFGNAVDLPGVTSEMGQNSERSSFVDLDGDGRAEQVRVDYEGHDLGDNEITLRRAAGPTRYRPVDVIHTITTGLGARTELSYSPLTVAATYLRGTNTTGTVFGRGSPVSDLRSAMYVVREAASSAPLAENAAALSRVAYRYRGARMQAGGRGFLGFEEVQSYDRQTRIQSRTVYEQSFPFTGAPLDTEVRAIADVDVAAAGWGDATTPCANDPDVSAGCFAYPASAWPVRGTVIKTGTEERGYRARGAGGYAAPIDWATRTTQLPATPTPLFVFRSAANSNDFELNTGEPVGSEYTAFERYDAWGNPLRTVSTRKTSVGGTTLKTVTTDHTYGSGDDPRYGRLDYTRVETSASGDTVTRETKFRYTPTTRLLRAEVVAPGNALALITAYDYDSYGNRTRTATCAGSHVGGTSTDAQIDGSVATCLATGPGDLNFTNPNTLRRYQRTVVDSADRRYAMEERGPFASSGGAAVEEATMQLADANGSAANSSLSRNKFGEPIAVRDAAGGWVRYGYGAFGRRIFEGSNSGSAKTQKYRYCTGQLPSGISVATQTCPAGAKYVIETTTAGAPRSWAYFDVLGREMLSVVQGYRATEYVAVATEYDTLSRVARKSLPTIVGTAASMPATSRFGRTRYDALGRVTESLAPDGALTTIAYGTLVTTTTSPPNKNGATSDRIERRDALGQVVEVKDDQTLSANNAQDHNGDLYVCYAYRATGELKQMRKRTGVSCAVPAGVEVVTTIDIDDFGRKTSMTDPDKGTWQYVYNAAGELVREINSRGQCTETSYDPRGRVVARRDFESGTTSGCSGLREHFGWTFDHGPNVARGAMASETVGSSLQTKTFEYDVIGRLVKTTTTLEGSTYVNRRTFDEYGRTFQELMSAGPAFAAETGVLYEYTDSYPTGDPLDDSSLGNGHYRLLRNAEGLRAGEVHHEVLAMDDFGNVTRERRAGNAALDTQRSFDPLTGRILSISTGNGATQGWTYDWDLAGNLDWRRDKSGNYESFDYDRLNRLLTAKQGQASPITTLSMSYAHNGNILSRGATSYTYGAAPAGVCSAYGGAVATAGPHAVSSTSAGTATTHYCYDRSGNQLHAETDASNRRTVKYSIAEQAVEITATVEGVDRGKQVFVYGAGRERIIRRDFARSTDTAAQSTTHYVGGAEVIRTVVAGCANPLVLVRREYAGMVLTQKQTAAASCTSTSTTTRIYRFSDHLGSTDALVDASGNAVVGDSGQNVGQQRFDAFGLRRDAGSWAAMSASQRHTFDTSRTRKGYTGHEQLDATGLIHMNGRIYDPLLGRFIQADPIIQAPYDAQSLNRYTYVFNNPLANVDPTGYLSVAQRRFLSFIGTAVIMAGTAGIGSAWAAGTITTSQAVAASAAIGFVGGAMQTGTIRGGLIGAFQAMAAFGIGRAFNAASSGGFLDSGLSAGQFAARALSHGAVSGVVAELQGGKFGHGFASAVGTEYLSPAFKRMAGGVEQLEVVLAAIAGGASSKVAGGSFANGAMTGAITWALNGITDTEPTTEDAAWAILDRVNRDFEANRTKPVDVEWDEFLTVAKMDKARAKDAGVSRMSDAEFGAFVSGGDGDSSFAQSALLGARYNIRGGPRGMSGVRQGSDVNYYYQGFLWAERGAPIQAMDLAISAHNLRQAALSSNSAERQRNITQIERAKVFAHWGYAYMRSGQ